jgi:hypothetical protein
MSFAICCSDLEKLIAKPDKEGLGPSLDLTTCNHDWTGVFWLKRAGSFYFSVPYE